MRKDYSFYLSALFAVCLSVAISAQTSEFTYQGTLKDAAIPANGSYDLQFALFDSLSGGTQVRPSITRAATTVSGGAFTVRLDFDASAFTGADRFLEVSVRTAGGGTYSVLSPRQQISSSPYSIKAANASSADSLSGACMLCITDAHIQSLDGGKLTGIIAGNGSGLTNLNGANINAGSVTSVQIAPESLPNSTQLKLLGLQRWDLLKPQTVFPAVAQAAALAFDGANMWVVSTGGNSVAKLRASDGANLGSFPTGIFPQSIVFDGANLWTANVNSNNVTKLRASDGANLGTFAVGTAPYAITFDGTNIWTANHGSDNVTKLRASDGANHGTFPVVTFGGPVGIAFDGANIWVANQFDDTVSKLRTSDGALLGKFPLPLDASPRGVVFDGTNIWVANNGPNNLTKLRASDGSNQGTFTVGNSPYPIVFDGANIWVANQFGNSVTKVRASDGANLGSFPVGPNPIGIAFDGTNIWVTSFNNGTVTRLFPAFPSP
jgi:hypothetical protein